MTNPNTYTDNISRSTYDNCDPDALNSNLNYFKYACDEITDLLVTAEDALAAMLPAPTGDVAYFAFSGVPSGFLECNGAAVSRTTYSALFAVIGTTFGAGNGSTTFNVPDLRGYFVKNSNSSVGTVGADSNVAHIHTRTNRTGTMKVGTQYNNPSGTGWSPVASITTGSRTSGNSSVTGTEFRPVNTALMACIKT